MIIIRKDRSVYIPESDRHIGFENDHLVESRLFQINDKSLFGFSFKLDIKNTLDIVDLVPYKLTDDTIILRWDISAPVIGGGGIITAQLRAFDTEGERVWHSAVFELVSEPSVNAEKAANEERIITEFEQLETRVQSAVEDIEDSVLQAQNFAKEASDKCNEAKIAKEDVDATAQRLLELEADFEQMTGGYEVISGDAKKHYENTANPHGVTASQTGAYTCGEVDGLLSRKAEVNHTHTVTAQQTGAYTKREVDTLLSSKADVSHTHIIKASDVGAYSKEETDGLLALKACAEHTHGEAECIYEMQDVDLTTCTSEIFEGDAARGTIGKNYITQVGDPYFGSDFIINVSGYVKISASTDSYKSSIIINGKNYSFGEEGFCYEGEINSPIEVVVMGNSSEEHTVTFNTFLIESDKVSGSTLGMMPEGSLKMLYEADKKLGDINTALDNIIAMQENLIGGGTV